MFFTICNVPSSLVEIDHLISEISPFSISIPVILLGCTQLPSLKKAISPGSGNLGLCVWPTMVIKLLFSEIHVLVFRSTF